MKRFFYLLTAFFLIVSCNENSSISIMQAVSTSQKKSEKRWSKAKIVRNSDDEHKVDFVCMIANDGFYAVNVAADQTSSDFLGSPDIKNNPDIGVIRNIFIPKNYSSSSPKVIIQTTLNELWSKSHFYIVDLKGKDVDLKEDGVSFAEISLADTSYTFISESLVSDSDLIMYKDSDKYYIGQFILDDENKFNFSEIRNFSASEKFSNFWESSSEVEAVVLSSSSGDEDIREQEYYSYDFISSKLKHYEKLSDIAIRNFIVYWDENSDPDKQVSFMALGQSGNVIHSESTKKNLYTSDSSFSYNRYTVPVVFRNRGGQSGLPDVTVFAKYNGNGFIIYSYKKVPENNRIYDRSNEGSVQTSGFAQELRAEDISELKAVKLSDTDYNYRIVVLSTENGVSTYKFNSFVPKEMKSNGVESRNRIDVFE